LTADEITAQPRLDPLIRMPFGAVGGSDPFDDRLRVFHCFNAFFPYLSQPEANGFDPR